MIHFVVTSAHYRKIPSHCLLMDGTYHINFQPIADIKNQRLCPHRFWDGWIQTAYKKRG
jgi:hypothetical protein